jgi:hypothetical protein
MSIVLSVGATSVQLPADLYWSDELAWHPVGQSTTRSVGGSLIVQLQATTTAGRPITLQPPVERASWMRRGELDQLKVWADTPGLVMTLLLRGVARDVMWRHQDGQVMAGQPVLAQEGVESDDAYTATLKLMEV